MEEHQTIRRAKSGNRSAQRKLYDSYRSVWYLICLRYVAESNDANDVLQNALVKIFTRLGDFESKKGSFRAWSCTVVANECLMYLRQRKGHRTRMEEYTSVRDFSAPSTVVSSMTVKDLLALIQALPEGYRTVFNMYAIEGYSHKEISQKLGVSIGTSKSQLHKARKLLQEMVHKMFEVISQ